jgi:hypothetical protein
MKMENQNSIHSNTLDTGYCNRYPESDTNCQIYQYKLERPVICTLSFRDFVTGGDPHAMIVPIKCGSRRKLTQGGFIKLHEGYSLLDRQVFRGKRIAYELATQEEFENAQNLVKIKIFFKGFPATATEEDIGNFFSWYGPIEDFFVIGLLPIGHMLKVVQGYFSFKSNADAQNLLKDLTPIYYQGYRIFCDNFNPQKLKDHGNSTNQAFKSWPNSQGLLEDSRNTRFFKKEQKFRPSAVAGIKAGQSIHHSEKSLSKAKVKEFTSQIFFNNGVERPYLKNLGKVKSNSIGYANIRFNIYKPVVFIPSPDRRQPEYDF